MGLFSQTPAARTLSSLNEGAKVSYEVVANRGKESAENLRVG